MNGTIYEEIKKNDNSKKKEKLKYTVAIFSTNILTAILCLSLGASNKAQLPSKIILKTLHPHFKMIVIPLTVLIDIDPKSSETPVTLMNKSKKILIPRAYLHEIVPSSLKELENVPRFKIEIPEDEVLLLSADSTEPMIAIPEVKLTEKVLKLTNKRVSQYEINL